MNSPSCTITTGATLPGDQTCADASALDADLKTLGQLAGDDLLALASDAASILHRAEAVLVACSNEVAIRSDKARGSTGLAARLGFARPSQLLEQVTGASARMACRYIALGAATAQRVSETGMPLPALFPSVGNALAVGEIGLEAAEAITKVLAAVSARADLDDLAAAEAALVGQATGQAVPGGRPLPADLITAQARVWQDVLDPDGIEPRAEEAFAKRDFWMGSGTRGGVVPFGGRLTVDAAAKLSTLFSAMLTPRTDPQCLPEQEQRNSAQAESSGRAKDTRTPGQQRADIFAAMIDSLARAGNVPSISGAAPTVLVTVPIDVLEKKQGTGHAVGATDPVPHSAIEQIICDGELRPVVLGGSGDLLRFGRTRRPFSRAQKLAIIARDGPTCKECNIPASACEVHHVIPWSEGGATDVSNGVILCWYDHHKMHAGEWRIEMVDGRPVSIPPAWLKRKPYFR